MRAVPRTTSDLTRVVLLAAVYALVGWVTLSLPETVLELRRMIWPSSGIALAWLMLGGPRLWPGVAIGAAATTALTGGAPLHVFGTAVANTGEVVLAVWLLRRAGIRSRISSRLELVAFLLVVGGTTAVSALLSVGSLVAAGQLATSSILPVWLNWWLTHAMGPVVLTPFCLELPRLIRVVPRRPSGESLLLIGGLGATLMLSFTPLSPAALSTAPLAFLCFPFLFWAAYRWGSLGAASASVAAAAAAVTCTLLGVGPFVHPSPNTSLFQTLLFVSVASSSTLFVAGLVAERQRAESERKEMERRVRRSEKLESLGALAGGIAHDFNNLLVAIAGNVDLVLLDSDPDDPAREPLRQSVRASERAAELCRQLLAYAGQGPFDHSVVDLRPIVEEMGELLRVTAPPGTTVEYELGDEVLPVRADVSQLRQVVINVVSNAGDALAERPGRISLRTWTDPSPKRAPDLGEGTFFLDPPVGPLALLQVEDDGEGIAEADLERIFEPLFTTRGMGRGLGLASVLGIVRSHGGAIHVASEPGRGSRFTILLPRASAPVQAVPRPPVRTPLRGTGMVVVVDDEPAVRKAAARLVARLGYEPVVASDGVSALGALEEHGDAVRWVLLDMTMPHVDGIETLRRIRARGWAVPVLLSSGYVLRPIEAMSELGTTRFLPKPYTLTALEEAVAELLRIDPDGGGSGTGAADRGSSGLGLSRGSI